MASSSRSSLVIRACDNCKKRKVKCDSANPCATCRISHLACHYTSVPKRRGPRGFRQRKAQCLVPQASSPETQQEIHQPVPEPLAEFQSEHSSPLVEGFGPLQPWQSTPAITLIAPTEVIPIVYPPHAAYAVLDSLLQSIKDKLPSLPIVEVANSCIDLYMQYTFATAPIIHEASLRSYALNFFSGVPSPSLFEASREDQRVASMRSFTFITALCASVSSVMPASLQPHGPILDRPFLRASREMLKLYEDYDLEHPNSSSLAIRCLQSTAMQHTTGKKNAAFHVVGQATLLAQSMHLYSEDSILRDDAVESQLLRLNFWNLYSADNAGLSLGTRPCILHPDLFSDCMTLHPLGEPFTPLLDPNNPRYEKPYEERLLAGFHLLPRLWSSASSLLRDIKTFNKDNEDSWGRKSCIAQSYLDFVGVLDALPSWLQISSLVSNPEDNDAVSFQKRSFWMQRCTLTMTFSCLRLVILRECIDSGLCSIMGLSEQPLAWAMKQAEMIQDFLQTFDDIPFAYHQIKGEPSVERIRRVGTILLALIQNVDNDIIKKRANSYFERILDSLARLNSKASEELTC
ncbi:hypothetical protein P170DRAFT_506282 [Aspergillus steynii IBT 23096]|uniref:Zn(2)-C6 fungal-type domain-containing protein n=1 Tax=Aspergillus steynii IBT 23096 TaxID=1392250 RepID=A0A2I2GSB3_9EURO|nr:uncharacterized protein P170DRAFT_506282 [Aspergillus steynii IBT 23096]PLB55753.1 hypothetical protein P170DRAFT_506282 [Aspergillus steynii IBT 23096]